MPRQGVTYQIKDFARYPSEDAIRLLVEQLRYAGVVNFDEYDEFTVWVPEGVAATGPAMRSRSFLLSAEVVERP